MTVQQPSSVTEQSRQEASTAVAEAEQGGGGRRRLSAYATRDLTQGSIPKTLWFIAWPQIVTDILRAVDQLADLFWAGFISFNAVATTGISQTYVGLFNTGRTGLDAAARAMISRAIGAKDIPLANHLTMQSLLLNSMFSATWITLAVIFSEGLLRVLGVADETVEQGVWYMRYRFMASFFFTQTLASSAALAAAGDTMTAMKGQGINRVMNIVLMPTLVFGWFGLPAMGFSGTGMAFLLAQLPGTVLNYHALFTGVSRLQLRLSDVRFDVGAMWRQMRIGLPASVTGMERSLAQIVIYGLVAPFGDLSLAAYALTSRLQNFMNVGFSGLGSATGILVGQNIGAQRPERAKSTVWWALGGTGLMSIVVGGLILAFPHLFIIVFTRDQALVELSVQWLQIMVLGFLAMGVGTVFMQTFNTAGDTFVPMVVTLASIWGIQQPVAILLSGLAYDWRILGWQIPVPQLVNLGEFGIAWAMVIALAVRLFVYFPYFLWGPWMKKRVL